jgi:hypothetical protein
MARLLDFQALCRFSFGRCFSGCQQKVSTFCAQIGAAASGLACNSTFVAPQNGPRGAV